LPSCRRSSARRSRVPPRALRQDSQSFRIPLPTCSSNIRAELGPRLSGGGFRTPTTRRYSAARPPYRHAGPSPGPSPGMTIQGCSISNSRRVDPGTRFPGVKGRRITKSVNVLAIALRHESTSIPMTPISRPAAARCAITPPSHRRRRRTRRAPMGLWSSGLSIGSGLDNGNPPQLPRQAKSDMK
jgi:hypothetical protein